MTKYKHYLGQKQCHNYKIYHTVCYMNLLVHEERKLSKLWSGSFVVSSNLLC